MFKKIRELIDLIVSIWDAVPRVIQWVMKLAVIIVVSGWMTISPDFDKLKNAPKVLIRSTTVATSAPEDISPASPTFEFRDDGNVVWIQGQIQFAPAQLQLEQTKSTWGMRIAFDSPFRCETVTTGDRGQGLDTKKTVNALTFKGVMIAFAAEGEPDIQGTGWIRTKNYNFPVAVMFGGMEKDKDGFSLRLLINQNSAENPSVCVDLTPKMMLWMLSHESEADRDKIRIHIQLSLPVRRSFWGRIWDKL